MSQAVAEEKVVFTMPRPRIGQDVDWFPMGDKKRARRAVVRRVFEKKIELMDTMGTPGGGWSPLHVCFHCDDPVVINREMDFSQDGTWDFTPEEKSFNAWKADVEMRLANLEGIKLKSTKKDSE